MVDWPVNDDAFEVRSAPARPGLSVIKSVKFDNSGKPEIASSNVCELPHVAMLSTQRAIRSEDFISIEVVDKCATQTEIRSRRRSGNCSGRERQSPAHMLSNVPSVRLKFIAAEGSTRQDRRALEFEAQHTWTRSVCQEILSCSSCAFLVV